MNVKKLTFSEVVKEFKGQEGLVFLGAGGPPQEWVVGVSKTLKEEGIASTANPEKLWEKIVSLTTSKGRTDLFFVFKAKTPIEIGKLAMWRLRFGDCSWWSDYQVNFKKDF